MVTRVRVVWSEDFAGYDFGPQHPMSPIRLRLTARLAKSFGLLDGSDIILGGAGVAPDELLETVHDPEYIEAVHRASDGVPSAEHGLGIDDNPIFPAIHDSSARIVQACVDAAEMLWRDEVDHAIHFCGGMHHAFPQRAEGFCIYNDAAVAINRLLELGAERVAYVDVDAHHGDGVEAAFWNDPRVMTISIHESGATLFPGTGFPDEMGGPDALGSAVNVALPAKTKDAGWLRAIDAIVPPVLRHFKPDVIVSQHGADANFRDPLSHLELTVDGQRQGIRMMHDLAHEVSGGRWLALGGGGYEIIDVVPRVWTHMLAIAEHRELSTKEEIPSSWRTFVETAWDRRALTTMGDGVEISWKPWGDDYDASDPVDRAIVTTQRTVFDVLGIPK